MNHYAPLQILNDDGTPSGLWRYCCTTGRGSTFAVGACGVLAGCPACAGRVPTNPFGPMILPEGEAPDPAHCPRCNGTGVVNVPPEGRCPGHPTAEGACDHYKSYLIAHARLHPETADMLRRATSSHKCQSPGCRKFTVGYAQWGSGAGGFAYLCDAHCTREALALIVTVGESWSS